MGRGWEPPVPAQPLGISSWGPKEGPAGARRHVDHASPLPRPPRHTARGPVTEGASEKGQPSSLCGALGWRLPLGVRVGEEGGGAANRQGPVSCLA